MFPLYAALPPEQQLVVFTPPPPNTRKVILSTNLAESSVTIPGIKYVVDTGMVKLRVTQAATGLESLLVVPVSKSHAWQRTGRAGRESEGKVVAFNCSHVVLPPLHGKTPSCRFEKTPFPRSSAAISPASFFRYLHLSPLPQLKTIGINDVLNFNYLQAPSRDSLKRALQQLLMLGAVDRRSVVSRTSHDTGRADGAGTVDGDAPAGPCVRATAHSEQGLPLHGGGGRRRDVAP